MFSENGAIFCPSLYTTTSIRDKETFNDTADNGGRFPDVTTLHFARVDDLQTVYNFPISYNSCGKRSSDHYYYCNISDSGDHDLCPQCITDGAHCNDKDHYLIECIRRDGTTEGAKTYYSSVRGDGTRDKVQI